MSCIACIVNVSDSIEQLGWNQNGMGKDERTLETELRTGR